MGFRRHLFSVGHGLLFSLFIMCSASEDAAAHRVQVYALQEGDTVRVDAKFAGGRKVKGGRVLVLDEQEKVLHEGATDEEGSYAFNRPSPSALTIVVEAGQGHRGEWKMDALEERNASPREGGDERRETPAASPAVAPEEMKKLVEEAVEKAVKPIRTMLIDSVERGVSLRDVMGGIGYIIGLVGLAAYFRAKALGEGGKGR